MKIEVAELTSILQAVAKGTSPKDILEQSTCFIFSDGEVVSYNDSVSVSHPLDVGFEGAVNAAKLLGVLEKISGTAILSVKKGSLSLKCGKVEASVKMEAEILLPIQDVEIPEEFRALPKGFLAALLTCWPSTSADMTREILTCVHIKDKLVESCDNFRATRTFLKKSIKGDLLIPRNVIAMLNSLKVDAYAAEGGWLHFGNPAGCVISCRTYSAEYPTKEISALFDIGEGTKITFPQELGDMVDRVGIMAEAVFDQDRKVTVTVSEGSIRVKGEGALGWLTEDRKCSYKGKQEVSFSIHPRFLQHATERNMEAVVESNRLKITGEGFEHIVGLMV